MVCPVMDGAHSELPVLLSHHNCCDEAPPNRTVSVTSLMHMTSQRFFGTRIATGARDFGERCPNLLIIIGFVTER